MLTAAAWRAIGIDDDVPECGGGAVGSGPELAADHESPAHAGAEREAGETPRASASACAKLAPGRAVRVVLERDWYAEIVREGLGDGDVRPAGEVICADEAASRCIELA